MEIGNEKRYVILGIDYFTRRLRGKVIDSKETKGIQLALEEWIKKDGFPEEIITDNGKEFCNESFRKWCVDNKIGHRKVGLEAHKSNGRIERGIRTLREAITKQKSGNIEEKLVKKIETYNRSYHTGIKCTPDEAWEENSEVVLMENSEIGEYSGKFKKRYREKFKKGQLIRIAKRENLGIKAKMEKGRFLGLGKIILKCEKDSYIGQMTVNF